VVGEEAVTTSRPRTIVTALTLALIVAGSGALAGPVAAAQPGHHWQRPWLGLAASLMRQFPALGDALSAMVGPSSVGYGSDGRLSVLIVGSDYRPGRRSERMDAVMVVTINPLTHQMAAVSIPRDTGALPLPDPSDTWKGKVNSMYAHYKPIAGSRNGALDLMRAAIAYALDIEIDNVVFARFSGFDFLVDQVGHVPVDIPLEIRDSSIVDDKTMPHGALFPAGPDYALGGANATKCHANGPPINWATVPPCHRALLYVRSRHGKVGLQNNSNYQRDKRQQSFLMAALDRVVDLVTADGSALTTLRDAASTRTDDFYTDLPLSDDADLLALFMLFNGAQDQPFQQVTLKPKKYAKYIGSGKYALKLDVVRALTHEWFAPVE
jgi:anionic cell wall polymer biosynthesis LytR-Cps2A-Psr (LCP) family protein